MAQLSLMPRTRSGGGGKTEQQYLDFVIDGQSLGDLLNVADRVGCLGWDAPEYQTELIAVLRLEKPSSLETGRAMIYVCPECGDIGCGAITVQIEETEHHFVWHRFGYENDYDPSTSELVEYAAFGPFVFDKADYRRALKPKGEGEIAA